MGISIWQLLIILAIVLVLFGAKRVRGLGTDLGSAARGFRQALRDDTPVGDNNTAPVSADSRETTRG